jgi:PTH1 family peptidyl-tRNA hydrolase
MLQLVVFLGNPGLKYRHNRHNAGYLLADALPFSQLFDWQKKHKGLYTTISAAGLFGFTGMALAAEKTELPEKLHFLKPQTFMNLSGESVQALASFHKIKLEEIIIVHDEIELPPGTISLKFSGGLGGHNGLRSIKSSFGSADFWRLRLGIGRPDGRVPGKGGSLENSCEAGIADWVLSDFTDAEFDMLTLVFEAGAELLVHALSCEPEKLLPEWGKKKLW